MENEILDQIEAIQKSISVYVREDINSDTKISLIKFQKSLRIAYAELLEFTSTEK